MKIRTKDLIIAALFLILQTPNTSASDLSIIFTEEQFAFREPPKDVWFKIFDYLYIGDLLHLAKTCKKLRALSSADKAWEKYFAEYYTPMELPPIPLLDVLFITSPKYRSVKKEIKKYQEQKNNSIKLEPYPLKKKLVEHEHIITNESIDQYMKDRKEARLLKLKTAEENNIF